MPTAKATTASAATAPGALPGVPGVRARADSMSETLLFPAERRQTALAADASIDVNARFAPIL